MGGKSIDDCAHERVAQILAGQCVALLPAGRQGTELERIVHEVKAPQV